MTIQLKAQDLDRFWYSEEYRIRYVGGEPEEYDYCYWYLKNGNNKFELRPHCLDGSDSFAMDDTLVLIEVPEEWIIIAKQCLDGSKFVDSVEYKIL